MQRIKITMFHSQEINKQVFKDSSQRMVSEWSPILTCLLDNHLFKSTSYETTMNFIQDLNIVSQQFGISYLRQGIILIIELSHLSAFKEEKAYKLLTRLYVLQEHH
jgi:hypothetical protein